jgi:SAM-dependent methyltransferase
VAGPFGWWLSKAGKMKLATADGIEATINSGTADRAGLRVLGIPHMGLRIRMSRISSVMGKVDGESVLDAGCGPGLHTQFLCLKGAHVTGVDIDRDKIRSGKETCMRLGMPGAGFMLADLRRMPFRAGSFSLVLCSDVLEHIKDDTAAISEFSRVLRPGGRLVITVPSKKPGREGKVFGHVRSGYNTADIEKMVSAEGLRVTKSGYYCGAFGSAAWKMNRALFSRKLLLALTFYPLFLLSKMDGMLPKDHGGEGVFTVAEKPL